MEDKHMQQNFDESQKTWHRSVGHACGKHAMSS